MRRLLLFSSVAGALALFTPSAEAQNLQPSPLRAACHGPANVGFGVTLRLCPQPVQANGKPLTRRLCKSRPLTHRLKSACRQKYPRIYRHRRPDQSSVGVPLPYNCPPHGSFAIPCYIIECESHFVWAAHNPSGADGIYQLLPGVGPSHAAQHREAARKWAGGAGRSQWVC